MTLNEAGPLNPGVQTPDMSGALVYEVTENNGVNDVVVENEIVCVFMYGQSMCASQYVRIHRCRQQKQSPCARRA